MKKLILALALAAGFSQAHAGSTITLDGEQCTNTKICYDVPNDKGDSVDLYAVIIHPYVYLYVNGDQYKGTLPGMYPYPSSFTDLLMTDPLGNVLYLTATFSSHTTCTRYCTIHWALVGGTITLP